MISKSSSKAPLEIKMGVDFKEETAIFCKRKPKNISKNELANGSNSSSPKIFPSVGGSVFKIGLRGFHWFEFSTLCYQ